MYHIYMYNSGSWSWHEGPFNEVRAIERTNELNKALERYGNVWYVYRKWETVAYESVLW